MSTGLYLLNRYNLRLFVLADKSGRENCPQQGMLYGSRVKTCKYALNVVPAVILTANRIDFKTAPSPANCDLLILERVVL